MSNGRRLFGTDGIRGQANIEPMTSETIVRVGRAMAHICKERRASTRHRIVIGKDTRLSGYMLETALASGICSMGVDILLVGPLPTPGIAFITSSMRADAGVVLSASHNPFQDNGIKFFDHDGFKFPDDVEEQIEEHVFGDLIESIRPTATEIGKARRITDAQGRYVVHLKTKFPPHLSLEGMRIVLDCAHGAAYQTAPLVFEELGAEVIKTGVSPDGLNINRDCGSLYPDRVSKLVREHSAHLGLALDGDADRLIVVDERGEEVDGDQIMAICARKLKDAGALANNTVVATVMSNMGLDISLKEEGISLERTQVGDRYVVERMRAGGFNFGGAQSGHLVFLDHGTTGDGTLAALQLLAVMVSEGKPLSELAGVMTRYPQVLKGLMVREKLPVEDIPALALAIKSAEEELGDNGRVLVRYSGTENKLRVMVEGDSLEKINSLADDMISAADEAIGA
ncbi:MAG: phosphoglucosamine mutase [Deltaproteobacteria bacterium]|nr:MAG: phosphoglucosamine mutase [Deltaproteobacteria bacterium]